MGIGFALMTLAFVAGFGPRDVQIRFGAFIEAAGMASLVPVVAGVALLFARRL